MPTPALSLPFENTYARELEGFYAPWQPAPAPRPAWVKFNRPLLKVLGLATLPIDETDWLAIFAGQAVPEGATPLAQAYAGHQFGGFSPKLGDGRALVLGEILDPYGQRHDIAFKGSGRTPFSRGGDGKCALGPALREYLISEAMAGLGIPTTRTLAVVSTGEMIRRDRALPGAILTRTAASHLRVGTFEFFAAHHDIAKVKQLADYAIRRHDPDLATHEQPYLDFLSAVAARQSQLIAAWLSVGFIHGVMNTDNTTISGETIDYGPCAFMDAYHPATVFSSIDTGGRYAYNQQADIAQWNLARLAETLLPLIAEDQDEAIEHATRVILNFPKQQAHDWLARMRLKLGIDDTANPDDDRTLVNDYLDLLERHHADFTLGFLYLSHEAGATTTSDAPPPPPFPINEPAAQTWLSRWQARQTERSPALLEAMRYANPRHIARNHLVENALDSAVDRNDLTPFNELLEQVCTPYDAHRFSFTPPASEEFNRSYRTFCGT